MNDNEQLPIAKPAHIGRKVGAVVLLVLLGLGTYSFATNEVVQWSVVGDYLFSSRILAGLWTTVELTVVSMLIAIVLAVVIANMRLSGNPVMRGASWIYVWFFRGVPLLVLLIVAYNFALIYPKLSFGIPDVFTIGGLDTANFITPFWAANAAFALQQGAYTSEVIRASMLAVPKGQIEAAQSLGMTNLRTMRRIVLPQAMRIAIPPVANDTINLLKATSLVAFISVYDLLFTVQQIYAQNYQVVPLLIVASIWYIVVVSIMSIGQYFLERRYGRGQLPLRVKTARRAKNGVPA